MKSEHILAKYGTLDKLQKYVKNITKSVTLQLADSSPQSGDCMLFERMGNHAMQQDISINAKRLRAMRKQHEKPVIRKDNAVIAFSRVQLVLFPQWMISWN